MSASSDLSYYLALTHEENRRGSETERAHTVNTAQVWKWESYYITQFFSNKYYCYHIIQK